MGGRGSSSRAGGTGHAALFEREAARLSDGYKTGSFRTVSSKSLYEKAREHGVTALGSGAVRVDWFLTRGKGRGPVIRVEWLEPTYATRRVYRNGWASNKKTWDNVRREQRFPFTEDGLREAIGFAESL